MKRKAPLLLSIMLGLFIVIATIASVAAPALSYYDRPNIYCPSPPCPITVYPWVESRLTTESIRTRIAGEGYVGGTPGGVIFDTRTKYYSVGASRFRQKQPHAAIVTNPFLEMEVYFFNYTGRDGNVSVRNASRPVVRVDDRVSETTISNRRVRYSQDFRAKMYRPVPKHIFFRGLSAGSCSTVKLSANSSYTNCGEDLVQKPGRVFTHEQEERDVAARMREMKKQNYMAWRLAR